LIEKFFPVGWSVGRRQLVVHIRHAPAHNSGVIQNFFGHKALKRLSHPPHFPDISPSDFCLFGKIKSALIGPKIPDEIHLLESPTEILNGISDVELQCVFRNWFERGERVIDAGWDYLTDYIFSSSLSHSRLTPLWPI
jgi:hypothetical protein